MRGLVVDFGGVLDGPDAAVLAGAVAELRARGVRTAVLSNDPGGPGGQVLRDLGGAFVDAVVLSGDVGAAKPDARIYRHVAEVLGVDPAQCVMVDDLAVNVRGAVAVGMVGVHHVDAAATVAELRILFDLDRVVAAGRRGTGVEGHWATGGTGTE